MFSFPSRAPSERPVRPAARKPRPSLVLETLEDRQVPTIYYVNSVADVIHPSPSVTTLREVITLANTHPNSLNPDAIRDEIRFNLAGLGVHSIKPRTALPTVTEAVIINGYTQPTAMVNTLGPGFGTNASLKVELNGGLLTKGESGLVFTGSGSIVRGLVINGFGYPDVGQAGSERHIPVSGIVLLGQGHNVVQGNFIGVHAPGLSARPNQFQGICVASSHNVIGGTAPSARNLISGNQGFGIHITAKARPGDPLHAPAEYNRVLGNLIGTNRSGTTAVANTGAGVMLSVFARNNVVVGTSPQARNVISGNGGPHTPFGDPVAPYQDSFSTVRFCK